MKLEFTPSLKTVDGQSILGDGNIHTGGGNVTYVPLTGDIQAYINVATAGDTLILASGTYVVTSTITVDRALLIKGQGLSATKVTSSTAGIAVFTLSASSARITDCYISNSGSGTTYGIYANDGLTNLQVRNVTIVTSGAGVKHCVYSKGSITISDSEFYPTSSDSNSNGIYFYNETGATANITANVQGVRVIATGVTSSTNGNRGLVAYNNNVAKTITATVVNSYLTAVTSSGSTDVALYCSSTTTTNAVIIATDCVLLGADLDVSNAANACTLINCTLINGTTAGTITYGGKQVAGTYNDLTLAPQTVGFTLAGGTTSKMLTINNTLTFAGTDASSVAFGAGGTVNYISAPSTQTANFTVGTSDWYINNKVGSTCIVTLPTASTNTGRSITFKNLQAQLVSSVASNVCPVDSATPGTAILLNVVGNWARLVSDGTNWVIMEQAPNNILLLE